MHIFSHHLYFFTYQCKILPCQLFCPRNSPHSNANGATSMIMFVGCASIKFMLLSTILIFSNQQQFLNILSFKNLYNILVMFTLIQKMWEIGAYFLSSLIFFTYQCEILPCQLFCPRNSPHSNANGVTSMIMFVEISEMGMHVC